MPYSLLYINCVLIKGEASSYDVDVLRKALTPTTVSNLIEDFLNRTRIIKTIIFV